MYRTQASSRPVRKHGRGLEAYRAELEPEAARYGVTLPPLRLDDDDAWQDKIDALLADPVEFVSFAFGLPGKPVVQALQKAGTPVISSVTSVDEALAAAEEGPDALAVQHSSAGGHTAAFLTWAGRDQQPVRRRNWSPRCVPPSDFPSSRQGLSWTPRAA